MGVVSKVSQHTLAIEFQCLLVCCGELDQGGVSNIFSP